MNLDIQKLQQALTPPPLFERGEPMWHDPYIAKNMLQYHLNESHDIASRRSETIDKIVGWITQHLDLTAGKHLLDLGCGPGLYTSRFARQGVIVTGVDYSQNSINYASSQDSQSTYLCQNYVELDLPDASFDVVMMIYGDFCVLSYQERDDLLTKIHKMLKPQGHFVFDVTQPQIHAYIDTMDNWSVEPNGGFWQPEPYLELKRGFTYPEDIRAEQYILINKDGTQTIYRNWFKDYTKSTIIPVLQSCGYDKIETYGDLTGIPYQEPADWMGVVAQKA